ncbi:MAG: CZB domain-containing protein [Thermoanaerobaculia bacterium]
MDFDDVIEAHVEWKMRLRILLESGVPEGMRPEEFAADDRCELGVWLRGEGRRFAEVPVFAALDRSHREFHQVAAKVIRQVADGERLEADATLTGEYARHSVNLVGALMELRRRAGTNHDL